MAADIHNATDDGARTVLESSESTAFYVWLLITVSAGIIMAQDTWVSFQQPRLSTMDATAAFTKVLVIHAIWLVVTLGFMAFTWFIRPTSAWRIHLGMGALTIAWTVGVLIWGFTDAERLEVTTWRCEAAPTTDVVTDEFLETCSLADMGSTIRFGNDIFLWSADDEHYWRWIVPGEGMATLQTRWPSHVRDLYLAPTIDGAVLNSGAELSVPGGVWSAGFDPAHTRSLRLFFIEIVPALPVDPVPEEADGS